jgi:hypothetical protein
MRRYLTHMSPPNQSSAGVRLAPAQFLSEWLARDPARLAGSLAEFVGHPAYGPAQLRGDLERFAFLLGGSDGEQLFGP